MTTIYLKRKMINKGRLVLRLDQTGPDSFEVYSYRTYGPFAYKTITSKIFSTLEEATAYFNSRS